jgi:gliding motility-associated-like protein
LFSSYYGGTSRDACYSVKVDGNQNVIFAGGTQSNNLTGISGTWQTTYGGGTADGFVVKLPSGGNSILAATYAGKGGYDQIFFVELDRNDNIYVLGQSVGSAGNGYMPVTNAAYFNGNSSNFIVKFNTTLSTVLNSTRFGNNSTAIHMSPAAFLVDNCGNIYVSGWGANILQSTPLSGMPITSDAFQATPPNGFDFYLFVLKGNFNTLLYGSYIGGNQAQEHVDGGTSRFDKNGVVYQSVCGGCGGFSDFPTSPGAWSATNESSNCNNIIYKFSTGLIPVADFVPDQTAGCADFSVTFDNFSTDDDTYLWDFGNGNLDSTTFEPTILYDTPGTYTVNLYVTDSICLLTDTAQITINVYPEIVINAPSPVNLCGSTPYTLTADSDGTGDYFIWSTSPTMSPALNSPSDSSIVVTTSGTYFIEVGNAFCSKIDTVVVNYSPPPSVGVFIPNNTGCAPFTATINSISSNADSLIWTFGTAGNAATLSSTTSQTFTFNTPGNYIITVAASNEICPNSSTSSASLVVLQPIDVSTLTPIYICNNDPYTLVANISGSPTNVIWSDQPNFSTQLNSGPGDYDIVVSTSGTYYVQAANGYCSDTASTVITFDSPAQASFTPNNPAGCGPLTVSFDNTSVQTQSYLWDFGNGILDSTNFEPTVTYTSPGQYEVVLIISDPDCPAADTANFMITVLPQEIVDLNDTISLCNIIPLTFDPITASSATSFVWSSNSAFSDTLNSNTSIDTLMLQIPQTGYYYLSVSNGFCSTEDSVLVNFVSLDIEMLAEDSICFGENGTASVLNLQPSVNLSYTWSPSSIIVSNQGSTVEISPGFSQYIYVSASGNGCLIEDSIFINVSTIDPTTVIASASDYIVAPGTVVTLFGDPSGMSSYMWTPSELVVSPISQQTDATINEDIIFTLTVSDGICSRQDTVEIKVYEIICEDPYVFIPNAFSPNGDNENDVLYVRGIWIEKMIFRIFDRWGELVFESTDVAYGWDGSFRGKMLDPDVYDFYLDVTCIGGLKSITKGNVTLMK